MTGAHGLYGAEQTYAELSQSPEIRRSGSSRVEYTNSQIATIIDELIHSERDRNLLKDRFINGIPFERLAEKYELSVRQTKNIVYRAADKFGRVL